MAAEVPTEAVVRASSDRGQTEQWTLVLEAMAIPHRIVPTDAGFAVVVPPQMLVPAMAALDAQDEEAQEAELETKAMPPDHGRSYAGVAMAVTLLAFFTVTGPRGGSDGAGWFRRGAAAADAIVQGHELWRAATALTLHADIMHVAGNAVATLIFVSALGRWLGGGLALAATFLAGFAGNLLTALSYGSGHNSVGASTATFGALGLLGGLQLVQRARLPTVGRFRRALVGVAAALGLFAMLGVGERVDVVAHAFGLGVGTGIGVLAGLALGRPVRAAWQLVALAATAASVAGAWLLAFRLGA